MTEEARVGGEEVNCLINNMYLMHIMESRGAHQQK